MDKKKLNNEIICCRAAVRKARVAVIRKIIKKMKILKTCKLESVKEKKLRKSERLFEKVQLMKKLKDDDVTKFALRHKDLEVFLKGPESDLKQNSLASLAKHDAVVKKVNSIRVQFSDWERELPVLLDSLEKKRKGVVNSDKSMTKTAMPKKRDGGKVAVKPKLKIKSPKKTQPKHKPSEEQSDDDNKAIEIPISSEKLEKIEDPFFIEKKVIAPKLVQESFQKNKSDKTDFRKKPHFKKDNRVYEKSFKMKNDFSKTKMQIPVPKTEEEKLHPSWAAKKVKLIKPFEGKKIMFSDE